MENSSFHSLSMVKHFCVVYFALQITAILATQKFQIAGIAAVTAVE